jgi:hypothetical protein
MIPIVRVQRGPSEAARCASTGNVPATSYLFSASCEIEHSFRHAVRQFMESGVDKSVRSVDNPKNLWRDLMCGTRLD